MKRFLSKLLGTFKKSRRTLSQQRRVYLQIESLEGRELMSAGAMAAAAAPTPGYVWQLQKVLPQDIDLDKFSHDFPYNGPADPNHPEWGTVSTVNKASITQDHASLQFSQTYSDPLLAAGNQYNPGNQSYLVTDQFQGMPATIQPGGTATVTSNLQFSGTIVPSNTTFGDDVSGYMRGQWGQVDPDAPAPVTPDHFQHAVGENIQNENTTWNIKAPGPGDRGYPSEDLVIRESFNGNGVTQYVYSLVSSGLHAPTLTAKAKSGSEVTLSWSCGPGATGFYIYQSGLQKPIVTVTNSSYVVPKLQPGTTYTFTVGAFNGAGNEVKSNPASATTLSGQVYVDGVKESDTQKNTIEVTYHIDQYDVGKPFEIKLFRAAKDTYAENVKRDLISLGSQTISGDDLKADGKPHVASFKISHPDGVDPLGIDPFHPYVLAVADPDHKIASEVNKYVFEQSFQFVTIGAVSEGFTAGLPWIHMNPKWVIDMTSGLLLKDHYASAIPFAWSSATPFKTADAAGDALFDKVVKDFKFLKSIHQANDIFQFHFIAHSRGCVAISRAVQDLYENAASLGLSHEYVKMTFLDPHPANLGYGLNAGVPFGVSPVIFLLKEPVLAALYGFPFAAYVTFEKVTKDGAVVVPPQVNEVEDFYQKTPCRNLTGAERHVIDLQGLTEFQLPGFVNPLSAHASQSTALDLTNKHVNGKGSAVIGHDKITDWYQINVIDAKKEVTGITMQAPRF